MSTENPDPQVSPPKVVSNPYSRRHSALNTPPRVSATSRVLELHWAEPPLVQGLGSPSMDGQPCGNKLRIELRSLKEKSENQTQNPLGSQVRQHYPRGHSHIPCGSGWREGWRTQACWAKAVARRQRVGCWCLLSSGGDFCGGDSGGDVGDGRSGDGGDDGEWRWWQWRWSWCDADGDREGDVMIMMTTVVTMVMAVMVTVVLAMMLWVPPQCRFFTAVSDSFCNIRRLGVF